MGFLNLENFTSRFFKNPKISLVFLIRLFLIRTECVYDVICKSFKVRCMKFRNRKIVSDLLSNFFEKVMDILLERVCSIISRDDVKPALSDSLSSCLDGHMLGHAILKKDLIFYFCSFLCYSP